MVLLVKVISIVIIIYGCLLLLRPGILKDIIGFMKKENRIYLAGATKAIVGVLLIAAASRCEVSWVVLFIGAISVFGGAVTFLFKKKLIEQILDWALDKPVWHVYLFGAVSLAVGILLALAV